MNIEGSVHHVNHVTHMDSEPGKHQRQCGQCGPCRCEYTMFHWPVSVPWWAEMAIMRLMWWLVPLQVCRNIIPRGKRKRIHMSILFMLLSMCSVDCVLKFNIEHSICWPLAALRAHQEVQIVQVSCPNFDTEHSFRRSHAALRAHGKMWRLFLGCNQWW